VGVGAGDVWERSKKGTTCMRISTAQGDDGFSNKEPNLKHFNKYLF